MLRALIFLVKVGALVAAAVWIADRPGVVRIEWAAYTLTLQAGFFLLVAVAALLLAIFVYRVIQTFAEFPASLRRYMQLRRQEAGYKALAAGLAAVAAGDKKAALHQSNLTAKLLDKDKGLSLLLHAQAERLQGREDKAREIFLALTADKDAGFLGVRGLLQAALDRGEHQKALELGRQALKMHPRQPWILKLVYDLEIRLRDWASAKDTLARAEKAGALPAARALKDRLAVLIAQAQGDLAAGFPDKARGLLEQACRLGPDFVPAVLALARLHEAGGRWRKAVAVIEKAWRVRAHPDLEKFWEDLFAAQKNQTSRAPMARLAWFERLVALNPQSAESHLAAGAAAAGEGLWGEAREHFRKAEVLEPSARLYRLWIALERRTGANPRTIEVLHEKEERHGPERRWVCRDTGRVYEEWQPVALPHGSFNTMEWVFPGSQSPPDSVQAIAGPPASAFMS